MCGSRIRWLGDLWQNARRVATQIETNATARRTVQTVASPFTLSRIVSGQRVKFAAGDVLTSGL
jgi:hypothetical protein